MYSPRPIVVSSSSLADLRLGVPETIPDNTTVVLPIKTDSRMPAYTVPRSDARLPENVRTYFDAVAAADLAGGWGTRQKLIWLGALVFFLLVFVKK